MINSILFHFILFYFILFYSSLIRQFIYVLNYSLTFLFFLNYLISLYHSLTHSLIFSHTFSLIFIFYFSRQRGRGGGEEERRWPGGPTHENGLQGTVLTHLIFLFIYSVTKVFNFFLIFLLSVSLLITFILFPSHLVYILICIYITYRTYMLDIYTNITVCSCVCVPVYVCVCVYC